MLHYKALPKHKSKRALKKYSHSKLRRDKTFTGIKVYSYTIGNYLYFTSKCIIEAMYVHASDSKLTEEGSAKFFVKGNGDSVIQEKECLNDREINNKIQAFIKDNYQSMYDKWQEYSKEGFYIGK